MRNIIHLLVIGSVFLISCSKKTDETTTNTTVAEPKTAIEFLRYKTWKLTAYGVNPARTVGGQTISDYYATMEECAKNNIFTYGSNNNLTIDEGATKCSTNDPQTKTQPYILSSNGLSFTLGTQVYTVNELTKTTFKYSYQITDAGTVYTYTYTYSKP